MKRVLWSVVVALLLSVVAVLLAGWALSHFWPASYPSSIDPQRYQATIAEIKSSDPEAAHLPDKIPASATSIAFFYQPGFMQGPTVVRLRLKLPPAEIADLDRKIRASYTPLTADDARSVLAEGIPHARGPTRHGRSWSEELEPTPEDFTSFLVKPDLETAKKNWNHPHNGGTSISTARNEVVYWVN